MERRMDADQVKKKASPTGGTWLGEKNRLGRADKEPICRYEMERLPLLFGRCASSVGSWGFRSLAAGSWNCFAVFFSWKKTRKQGTDGLICSPVASEFRPHTSAGVVPHAVQLISFFGGLSVGPENCVDFCEWPNHLICVCACCSTAATAIRFWPEWTEPVDHPAATKSTSVPWARNRIAARADPTRVRPIPARTRCTLCPAPIR